MQNRNKPVTDIIGTVAKAYPINQNIETGAWRPANFSIETESGVRFIKQFPLSYWDKETSAFVTPDPIRMPEWYNNLIATYGENLMELVGLRIKVRGEGKINSHSMEIEYTVAEGNFTVLQGEPKQDSEDAPPPPTAPSQPNQPKPYAPESRMEIGMATGNAKNGGYTVISAYYEKHGELPNDEFLTAFAERVNFFADALMNPPEEEVVLAVEADEPDEFESLGSI